MDLTANSDFSRLRHALKGTALREVGVFHSWDERPATTNTRKLLSTVEVFPEKSHIGVPEGGYLDSWDPFKGLEGADFQSAARARALRR